MARRSDINASDGLHRGAARTLRWAVVDGAGAAVTVTGFTTELRIYTADKATLLHTEAGAVQGTTNIDVTIEAADLPRASYSAGNYSYELWRTDTGNEGVLAYGGLYLH